MLCVQVAADGALELLEPQPADVATCSMVVAAPAEIASGPWNLTESQGEKLGGLILLAWATAWIFRRLCDLFEVRKDDEA